MAPANAAPGPLGFSCDCGAVRGHLVAAAVRSGTRVVCHCRDCRAAELHLGRRDPDPDGVDLFQTTPDMIAFATGADRLAVFRLGPKGPMRWYASCCGAPMFNTLASPKLPFVAIASPRLEQPHRLGPVRALAFVPQPGGGTRHRHAARLVWGVIVRMAAARLSGRWRHTPFFDVATGAPAAEPALVAPDAKAALYR